MKYQKKSMGSYNLHLIQTDRFKSISIDVICSNKAKKEEVTITNFLSSMLTYSTKEYPTRQKFATKLQDLYNAKIYPYCYRLGNLYNVDFNVRLLDEKYTEEHMLEETLDFLVKVLFEPNVENGKFDHTSFEVIKNEETALIKRWKEDLRKYCVYEALNAIDPDSPFSINGYGTLEDLEKITEENLYEFYKKFIDGSDIDVFVIGNIDFQIVERMIRERLKFRVFKKEKEDPDLPVLPFRKKPQTIIEKEDTTQAKLTIICLLDKMSRYERDYVLNAYNLILGGTADSKFFQNIREKYSLCYYVNSAGNKLDNLLIITSGITKDNLDKMVMLIQKEMKDMEQGKFSDQDIENAKKYYGTILDGVYDSPSNIISVYYSQELLKTDDISERRKKMNQVTREDIMKLAKKIHMDTIYLYGGDKQ